MNPERRQDDTRISDLQVAVARVESSLESIKLDRIKSSEETRDYRKGLCSKLDLMSNKLSSLPCSVREEKSRGISMQLRALWVLVSAALIGIISEWIKLK